MPTDFPETTAAHEGHEHPFDLAHFVDLGGQSSTYRHGNTFIKKAGMVGNPATEEHASRFMQTLALPHIPVRQGTVKAGPHAGAKYTHMPFVDAPTLTRARGMDRTHSVTPQRSADTLFGEWLANIADRHGGNYLAHPEHGAVSIDHGASFAPYQTQAIRGVQVDPMSTDGAQHSTDPTESSLFGHMRREGHTDFKNQAISPDLLRRAIDNREALEAHVRNGVRHLPKVDADAAVTAFHKRLDLVRRSWRMKDMIDAHHQVQADALRRIHFGDAE